MSVSFIELVSSLEQPGCGSPTGIDSHGYRPQPRASSSPFKTERVGDGADRGAPEHWTSNIQNPPVQCTHANFDVRCSSSGLLPDLGRGKAVFQTKKRRGLLRVEKVATKGFFAVAEDSVGNRVPEKSSYMSQLVFVGFPDGPHRVGTVVSVLKKEGAITCFVRGDSLFLAWRN